VRNDQAIEADLRRCKLNSHEASTFRNALKLCESLPYANGKIPVPGDYVKNQFEQPGTVTRVHFSHEGQDYIKVTPNDGSVDLPLAPAEEFTLISRQA
jgi:hypothetical protein